jgi:hypothetical protein
VSRVRRFVSFAVCGLFLSVATACTGPRVSQAEIEAARAVAVRATPEMRLVTVTPRPTGSKPIVVQASSGRAPTATPVPPATLLAPTSLRVPTGGRTIVTVESTGGEGLWVRRAPAGEPLRIWPDGSPMLVVGEDELVDGRFWRQVWTLDGQTGWAAAEFLIPADEQALTGAMLNLTHPQAALQTPATLVPEVHTRVAAAVATATSAPATVAPTSTRRPATFTGQSAAPAATARATVSAAATARATATAQPPATPVRAPAGATSLDVDSSTLTLIDKERALPITIGTRPRDGMELAAVQVRIANRGSEPLAVYRGAFRLVLSDRSRVEPLAGGETPVPYSVTVQPGDALEGWLIFEVPRDSRLDSLIWSPDYGTAYALGL